MDQSFAWMNAASVMSQGLTHDALGIATPPLSRWGSFSSNYASVTPSLSMCESGSSVEDYSLSSVESSPQDRKAQWSYVGNDNDQSRSALERLGFKLQLGEKKTRDGQAPKRRGPKPDSKPALTRRQELNRQAQRTHRERKEMYIKALEQEVYRLKEMQETVVKAKESCNEQCRQLKELLTAHGIPFDMATPASSTAHYTSPTPQFDNSSNNSSLHRGSVSVSTGFTSPPMPIGQPMSQMMKTENYDLPLGQPIGQPMRPGYPPQMQPGGIDYEQLGVDFVLTLERSCRDHIALLMVRSQKGDEDVAGHALMASCPPITYIENYIREHPDDPHAHAHTLPDVESTLAKLLVLNARVQWHEQLQESEVTPIAAWQWILHHPRFYELSSADVGCMTEALTDKVRCYGFGSVIESFEVRDAVALRLKIKDEAAGVPVMADQGWSPLLGQPWSPSLPSMRNPLGDMLYPSTTMV